MLKFIHAAIIDKTSTHKGKNNGEFFLRRGSTYSWTSTANQSFSRKVRADRQRSEMNELKDPISNALCAHNSEYLEPCASVKIISFTLLLLMNKRESE